MSLQKNPFFILKVPCTAGRRDILTAAEEMGFFYDSAVCADAQNALINPSKRLEAEIDWFPEADENALSLIQTAIENQELIPTDGLLSISRFNATLHNISVSDQTNLYEIGYDIIDVDDQFAALDIKAITDCINRNHAIAKIGEVSEQEIQEKLNKKRDGIRKTISDRLAHLDQNDYVSFITMLAEKCGYQVEHGAGSILFDVVDHYEVRMQTELENKTEEVRTAIKQIREYPLDNTLDQEIDRLIKLVQEWDKLAQPLQLKSQASGMPHQISVDLGYEIRGLSLFLHNEKNKTDEALKLTEAMKGVFAELGNLSDTFEDDAGALKNDKQFQPIISQIDGLKKQADAITGTSSGPYISQFITKINDVNAQIKGLKCDQEAKNKLREIVYYIGRGLSVRLHNNYHATEKAVLISDALYSAFRDIPSLQSKINSDKLDLARELSVKQANQRRELANERSKKAGCIVPLVFLGIGILALGIRSCKDSCKTNNTYKQSSYSYSSSTTAATATAKVTAKPSPTATPKPTPKPSAKKFSQSATVGDPVYATVTSVEPLYTITTTYNGISYGTVTDVVCKCKTKEGSNIYIWFSVSDYHTYIDSSATFNSIGFSDFETKTFSSGKKLYGKARNADNMCDGLASKTGLKLLMEFDSSVH